MQSRLLENIIQYAEVPASDLLDQIIEQTVSHKKRNRISEIINGYPSDKDVIPEMCYPKKTAYLHRMQELEAEWYRLQEKHRELYQEPRYIRIKYARPVSMPKMAMWTPGEIITSNDTFKVEYVDVWMDQYTGEIVPEEQVAMERHMSRNKISIACQPGCKCNCADCNVGDCWRCDCNAHLR